MRRAAAIAAIILSASALMASGSPESGSRIIAVREHEAPALGIENWESYVTDWGLRLEDIPEDDGTNVFREYLRKKVQSPDYNPYIILELPAEQEEEPAEEIPAVTAASIEENPVPVAASAEETPADDASGYKINQPDFRPSPEFEAILRALARYSQAVEGRRAYPSADLFHEAEENGLLPLLNADWNGDGFVRRDDILEAIRLYEVLRTEGVTGEDILDWDEDGRRSVADITLLAESVEDSGVIEAYKDGIHPEDFVAKAFGEKTAMEKAADILDSADAREGYGISDGSGNLVMLSSDGRPVLADRNGREIRELSREEAVSILEAYEDSSMPEKLRAFDAAEARKIINEVIPASAEEGVYPAVSASIIGMDGLIAISDGSVVVMDEYGNTVRPLTDDEIIALGEILSGTGIAEDPEAVLQHAYPEGTITDAEAIGLEGYIVRAMDGSLMFTPSGGGTIRHLTDEEKIMLSESAVSSAGNPREARTIERRDKDARDTIMSVLPPSEGEGVYRGVPAAILGKDEKGTIAVSPDGRIVVVDEEGAEIREISYEEALLLAGYASSGDIPEEAVSAAAASVIPEEGMDASAIGENGRISVSEGKAVLIADDGTERPLTREELLEVAVYYPMSDESEAVMTPEKKLSVAEETLSGSIEESDMKSGEYLAYSAAAIGEESLFVSSTPDGYILVDEEGRAIRQLTDEETVLLSGSIDMLGTPVSIVSEEKAVSDAEEAISSVIPAETEEGVFRARPAECIGEPDLWIVRDSDGNIVLADGDGNPIRSLDNDELRMVGRMIGLEKNHLVRMDDIHEIVSWASRSGRFSAEGMDADGFYLEAEDDGSVMLVDVDGNDVRTITSGEGLRAVYPLLERFRLGETVRTPEKRAEHAAEVLSASIPEESADDGIMNGVSGTLAGMPGIIIVYEDGEYKAVDEHGNAIRPLTEDEAIRLSEAIEAAESGNPDKILRNAVPEEGINAEIIGKEGMIIVREDGKAFLVDEDGNTLRELSYDERETAAAYILEEAGNTAEAVTEEKLLADSSEAVDAYLPAMADPDREYSGLDASVIGEPGRLIVRTDEGIMLVDQAGNAIRMLSDDEVIVAGKAIESLEDGEIDIWEADDIIRAAGGPHGRIDASVMGEEGVYAVNDDGSVYLRDDEGNTIRKLAPEERIELAEAVIWASSEERSVIPAETAQREVAEAIPVYSPAEGSFSTIDGSIIGEEGKDIARLDDGRIVLLGEDGSIERELDSLEIQKAAESIREAPAEDTITVSESDAPAILADEVPSYGDGSARAIDGSIIGEDGKMVVMGADGQASIVNPDGSLVRVLEPSEAAAVAEALIAAGDDTESVSAYFNNGGFWRFDDRPVSHEFWQYGKLYQEFPKLRTLEEAIAEAAGETGV